MQQNIISLPKLSDIYKGFVTIKARNVETGEESVLLDNHNTILKPWLEGTQTYETNFFRYTSEYNNVGVPLIGKCTNTQIDWFETNNRVLHTVVLGTDNTPASRDDTGIKGLVLASSDSGTVVARSTFGESPVYEKRKWVFPAGVGIGIVGEVLLKHNCGTGNTSVARQVLPTPFEKTALHELTVEWRLEISANSWSGVIPKGQRDGVTDINWTLTINNRQAWRWGLGRMVSGNQPSTISWKKEYIRVKTGTSNAPTDMANDLEGTIKGTELFNGYPSLSTIGDYTLGTYYRDINIKLDTNQSNGPIGEMLIACHYSPDTLISHFCRCTFDPPLDKVNTHQLLLTFRIAM